MLKNLNKYSEYFTYICGALLFTSVLMISAEVVLRKFFLISFGGVDELSGYALGISIAWSLSYVLFEKMHIRIDILYTKVSKKIQKLFDVIAMAFTLLFIGLLTYFSASVLYISFIKDSTANTPLGTPLWIPQSFWVLGYGFFAIIVLTLFIRSIKAYLNNTEDRYTNITKEEL